MSNAWENVSLIEDDFDQIDEDVSDFVSKTRGERRAPRRSNGEYRRSSRDTEDGYGELDFA